MYRQKRVFIVVPAYNEETQIPKVLAAIPDFVDRVLVVDDGSLDGTASEVEKAAGTNPKIGILRHDRNRGVGAARFTGFLRAIEEKADLIVAIDGDGQMDSSEIVHLLNPLVDGRVDFTKTNRLASGRAWDVMPRFRFFMNALLTLFTKIASGYWHVTDTQTGYFALTRQLAERIDYDRIYPRYGCENSLLIHLSVLNARVMDIPSRPIYKVGETTRIRVWRDWFPMLRLLRRGFFWRIAQKYIVRDFHPLVFFYLTGTFIFLFSVFYMAVIVVSRIVVAHTEVTEVVRNLWLNTLASPLVTVLVVVLVPTGLQMMFFAMWMDMQESQHLKEGNPCPFEEEPQTNPGV